MVGMVGAFSLPWPWSVASDVASYGAGIGLTQCRAEFNAPANKNILPDASTGDSSCVATITQENRMMYNNTFGVPNYSSSGKYSQLGKPSIYYFNTSADVNLRSFNNENGTTMLTDISPGNSGYNRSETFKLSVGKNHLEYRAESAISPYSLTPFFIAGLASSSPAKKSAVKHSRFSRTVLKKKFANFVKAKAIIGSPSAIISETADKGYFDSYRLSQYGDILSDTYAKRIQDVWVRDDIAPALMTRTDPENFALKVSEVVSYDPARAVFTLEAIHPGGIKSGAGFSLLRELLEYSDECDRAVSVGAGHDNDNDFWHIDDTFNVKWTASDPISSSDGHRNKTSINYRVEIKDTKPPIILAPAGKVIIASGSTGPIFVGEPSVFDLADLNVTVSGSGLDSSGRRSFSQGLTTIVWTAVDSSGNSSSAQQHIVVKPAGANTAPEAFSQSLTSKTYQQTEIILRGQDSDTHNGVHEPIQFDLVQQPSNGFFVAPLAPYFIEDLRLEATSARFIGNQAQNDPEEYCITGAGSSGTNVWHMQYPFDNNIGRDMWMSADDEGNSYILDFGAVSCSYDGDGLHTNLRLAKINNQGDFVSGIELSSDLNDGTPRAFFWDNVNNNIYMTYENGPNEPYILTLNGRLEIIARYKMSNFGITQEITSIAAYGSTIYVHQGRNQSTHVHAFERDASDGNLTPVNTFALKDTAISSMDVDNSGNLYTVNANHRLYKYDSNSTNFIGWMGKCKRSIGTGNSFNCNDDTQPDEDKRHSKGFSCTDETCSTPSVFAGKYPGQFTNDETKKIDISFSPADLLYVAETKTNRVQRFTTDGFPAGEAKTTGAGYGFILGDFNAITYIEVNQTRFFLLDQDSNLLHIFKTTPMTPVDSDNNGIIDGAHLVYQSNNNFPHAGSAQEIDTFTFKVNDGLADSVEGLVDIEVSRNYRRPDLTTTALSLVVNEDAHVDSEFNARDSDLQDIDRLSGLLIRAPSHGSVSFDGLSLTYTPESDYYGEDSFSFSGFDGSTPPAQFTGLDVSNGVAQVNVTVNPVADMPRLSGAERNVDALVGFNTMVALSYLNPDGMAGIEDVTARIEWGDGEVTHSGEVFYNGTLLTALIAAGVTFDVSSSPVVATYPSPYLAQPDLAGTSVEITDVTQTGPILTLDGNGGGTLIADHLYTTTGTKSIRLCVEHITSSTTEEFCQMDVVTVDVVEMPVIAIEISPNDEGVLKTESNQFVVQVSNTPFELSVDDPRFNELPTTGSAASNIVIEAGGSDSLTISQVVSNGNVCEVVEDTVTCGDDLSLGYGESFDLTLTVAIDADVLAGSIQTLGVSAVSAQNETLYYNTNGFNILADSDNDGIGDQDEIANGTDPNKPDTDGDGSNDLRDMFPLDPLESIDSDGDGLGNNQDQDDDNDGILDSVDAFPLDNTESLDSDGDGIGNNQDEDDDNDGILDSVDAFPLDNTESLDSDGDGIGNNSDSDDDNDGIVDSDDSEPLNAEVGDNQAPVIGDITPLVIEATGTLTSVTLIAPTVSDNNTNAPSISADSAQPLALGEHAITWVAIDFAGNQSTKTQVVEIVDTTSPVFSSVSPLTFRATAVISDISPHVNASAVDLVDGVIDGVIQGTTMFSSGRHEVTLTAQDAAGNTVTTTMTFDLLPEINVNPIALVEAGGHYPILVRLSGAAPSYPVNVEYEIHHNSHIISSNTLSISVGVQGQLMVDVPNNMMSNDTLTLNIVSSDYAFVDNDSRSELTLIEHNVPPQLKLSMIQNNKAVSVIDSELGMVTVRAMVIDVNQNDTHDFDWVVQDGLLTYTEHDSESESIQIDPLYVDEGAYYIEVSASEKNTSAQLSVSKTVLMILEKLTPLSQDLDSDNDGISDLDEGYGDSDADGISDYLDNDSNTVRLVSGDNYQAMQTTPGLVMSVGSFVKQAKGASTQGATMTLDELAQVLDASAAEHRDPHYDALTPLYNFSVDSLLRSGDSVAIVIALGTGDSLPDGAIYRQYDRIQGWYDIVENEDNRVRSALADKHGLCPMATDPQYLPGLKSGDTCIELLIEDGGPNDTDTKVNGVVESIGMIVVGQQNQAPVLHLESQYQVNEATALVIDASSTTDAEGDELTYQWNQLSGTLVEVNGLTQAQLTFTSPAVGDNEELTFELSVSDGSDTSKMIVTVMVYHINKAPLVVINAHDANYREGAYITLSAQGSDPDNDELRYAWTQLSGPTIDLGDASGHQLTLTLPKVNETQAVTIEVTVSDGALTATDTTTLNIVAKKRRNGGAMAWVLLMLLILAAGMRSGYHRADL